MRNLAPKHPSSKANRLKNILFFVVTLVLAISVTVLRSTPSRVDASASDYTLTEITTFLVGVGRADWSDWSADGTWIAYDHWESDKYWDVYQIRSDGTDNECLTCDKHELPNKNQGNPAYHPSGRYLLFQVEKKRHSWSGPGFGQSNKATPGSGVYNDLWVLDFETDSFYQLTDVKGRYPAGGSLHAHFSHDGSKLLWGDLERGGGVMETGG